MQPLLRVTIWWIHYLTPLTSLSYYIAAKCFAFCKLRNPNEGKRSRSREFSSTILWSLVALTYLGSGCTHIANSHYQVNNQTHQDDIFYAWASFCVHGFITLNLLNNKISVWYPYLGTSIVAGLQELLLLIAFVLTDSFGDQIAAIDLALAIARVTVLTLIIVIGLFDTCQINRPRGLIDGETESLLHGRAGAKQPTTTYRSIDENSDADERRDTSDRSECEDSDEDEPDDVKEVKAMSAARLNESGSWLAYIQGFKIFIPLLWPRRNRKIQVCLAIIGLVLVAERVLNVLIPRQLGIIFDRLTQYQGTGVLPIQEVGLYVLYLVVGSPCGIYLVQNFAELPISLFARGRIGTAAFSHIMRLDMRFHNNKSSFELCKAIDQGQELRNLVEFTLFTVMPLFADLAVALWYVSSLFDMYMTFILIITIIIYVHVGARTVSWQTSTRRKWRKWIREESQVKGEAISNWQTVSNFNRAKYECDRYGKCVDGYLDREYDFFVSNYVGTSALSAILLVARLSAFCLAVYRIVQGAVPIGNLVVLTSYWTTIELPVQQIAFSIRRLASMLVDAERLLQLLQTEPSVKEAAGAPPLNIQHGEVEFRDVDFNYDPRRPIIRNVSFTAKPGQTIALVGETGGGKSTILKLLYRYYDVVNGSISIDGQDIRDVTLDGLRDSFGMVPQDPTLFNISIMENVRYARLDATDEEVINACRAAAIHDKIDGFPNRYKTLVGERGVKLSGGELQRVAIARAILRRPRIVLLDEATSMIDAETEAVIQKALRTLTANRTTFIVAHRLSTIQHADQILVVSEGRIVERGTHDELLRLNGKYVALWSKQLSKEVQQFGTALDVEGNEETSVDLTASLPASGLQS